MPPPNKPRQPSHPVIRREEEDTPPSGSEYRDELARAMREPMPWWAALMLRKLDVDEWLRQRDSRIGMVEERVDEIEDFHSNTKVRDRAAAASKAKWGDRLWDLGKTVAGPLLVLIVLWLAGYIHVGQPLQPPKIRPDPVNVSKFGRLDSFAKFGTSAGLRVVDVRNGAHAPFVAHIQETIA